MLLPKFDFHEPKTLNEACQILAEYGQKARIIAGGTDLMVNMKKKILSPEQLVSISRISELKKLDTAGGNIRIGACFTVAELNASGEIQKHLSALGEGAKNLGTPLIRNLATIGGNLGTARPAADLPPALMAYGAQVVLKSLSGERTLSLDNFFLGPGFTAVKPDEILTEIRVPALPPGSGAGYINIGVRKGQDCNLVNVASFITLDSNGIIQNARIVMGCVGPVPLRALSAEKILIGQKPESALFLRAGAAASSDSTPIDDFRGSAVYKRDMAGVLTRRTLDIAFHEATHRQ
ncbi:MAG: xanthine dehydrogenase family protein subunit M [Deltaproteobacteria bacterium]|nr:xanthine dehydrogenase family protein subunit M [Deltaproteobacteria bacterium]